MKNKKAIKSRRQKSRGGKIAGYFILRIFFLILLIIPCLSVSYLIKRDALVVIAKKQVVATAYSSTVDQTDSTPCITANGFNLCENGVEEIIASNGLVFGTKVRLPRLFGNRVFTVADRMNPRYGGNRIDIWMTSREAARNFGARVVEMEIIK